MKDKLFSLQSAIVKYCENVQLKNPFIKNALQDLQGAISQEPEKTQGMLIYAILISKLLK
jgi:hypothetical protein